MDALVGWLGPAYLWVKALHVILVIFWMAGLFILPRYLVHQAGEAPGSPEDRKWVDRIARCKRVILTPSLILVWIVGLALVANHGLAGAGWLHIKLTLALMLSGYHGWMSAVAKRMARGDRATAEKTLRYWNEVPALFTILIVTLAIVKPL
jgi:putative membrane protein